MMGSYRARQSRAAKKAAEERIETLYNNVVAGESERSAMQQADMMARARTQADTIVREAEVTEADRAALRHEVGRLDLTILEPSLQRVQQREAELAREFPEPAPAAPAADDDAAMMADFAALLKAALAD